MPKPCSFTAQGKSHILAPDLLVGCPAVAPPPSVCPDGPWPCGGQGRGEGEGSLPVWKDSITQSFPPCSLLSLKGLQRGKHTVSQPERSLGFSVPASKPLYKLGCQPHDRSVQVWMPEPPPSTTSSKIRPVKRTLGTREEGEDSSHRPSGQPVHAWCHAKHLHKLSFSHHHNSVKQKLLYPYFKDKETEVRRG